MQDSFRYLDFDEELNISKDNIGRIIDLALKESNTDTYGKETHEYINFVCRKMTADHNISEQAQRELSDYGCDIANMAGDYSFQKGFKEGVRLFRTLMSL
ncbi:MAG: hypothetical protein K2G55_14000 [Lachnospiraceae bacterium]|nr:hypothetical protein [Lachnospiraceae bacterium]MDE7203848.1 hypothetical protein [Lachnospiraceae bacterium]